MATKPLTKEEIELTDKKMLMTLDEIIKMSKKPTAKVNNRRASIKSQKSFNGAFNQGKSSMVKHFMDSRSTIRQGALARRRTNFQENQFNVTTATAWKAAGAPVRNRPFNRVGAAGALIHNRPFNRVGAAGAPIRSRPFDRVGATGTPVRKGPFNRVGQGNFNKPRVGILPVQRRVNAAVAGKVKKQNQLVNTLPMKKPQTLDSLFANMKEERMRVQQNSTGNVAQHRQKGRGRFGNFAH